jgi:hypothetical protein
MIQNIEKKDYHDAERISKKRLELNVKNDDAKEIGGPKGLEPTRYGDWEKKGRCVDF